MPSFERIANALFGSRRAELDDVATDATTRTYIGTAVTDSTDGTVEVDLGGDVTLPDDIVDDDGNVIEEYGGTGIEVPTGPNVQQGDEVVVTLVGGGDLKEPIVTAVAGAGDRTMNVARAANAIAEAAQAVADAVNQHFWPDSNGIHVTEVTQEDFARQPQGKNILINSLGMLLRDAETWFAQFTSGVVAFYDGFGNAASNIFASFGRSGAQIGYADKSHMVMDYHSMSMVDKDGSTYFDVRDLRDEDGRVLDSVDFRGDGERVTFTTSIPIASLVRVEIDGIETTDYTYSEPDEGEYAYTFATAPESGALVEFFHVISTDGTYKTFAMGHGAASEGRHSYAFGRDAYTRGEDAIAIGHGASIDEEALPDVMALGRYNCKNMDEDVEIWDHAVIFGNGTDDANRSNAGVANWDGSVMFGEVIATDKVTITDVSETRNTAGLLATGSRRGVTANGDWLVWDDSNGTHVRDWEPRILSQETSSSISVPNATDRSIVTLQINEPGCWLLIAHVVFNSNATGRRVMGITTAANASLGTGASSPIITQAPVSGGATAMTVIDVVSVGWTGGLTRYLTVYQNSGGALNCQGSIKAVRVMMPA